MQGKLMDDIKTALSAALSKLDPDDSFSIIAFNGEIFSTSMELASKDTVERAIEWIKVNFVAEGATNILHPIKKAMDMLSGVQGSIPIILLVTDGSVMDERHICDIVKKNMINEESICPRIYTFGIESIFGEETQNIAHEVDEQDGVGRQEDFMDPERRKQVIVHLLLWWLHALFAMNQCFMSICVATALRRRQISRKPYTLDFHTRRVHLRNLIYNSDIACFNQIRMNRATFDKLCLMLDIKGGLKPTKNMLVDEQVAMFLHILAHHQKNRVIQFYFGRSGETISRHFNIVLTAMMRLSNELFKKPQPIPEDSTDTKWKWFKNCLGALDGTHVKVKVPVTDKGRYRNRKGDITINVLGVCSPDAQFIYVLTGWEGSAADGRVLRDAIHRRSGSLKVPLGQYYLVDAGYTNCEGFLAPFRGQRYHLSEWRDGRYPVNARECFNMRHASARNVIERCFGMLKLRWAILRSPSFYPIRTHNRIVMACCLLHNLIRQQGSDPLENEVEELDMDNSNIDVPPILTIEPSNTWSNFRDSLANEMFVDFRRRRDNRIEV